MLISTKSRFRLSLNKLEVPFEFPYTDRMKNKEQEKCLALYKGLTSSIDGTDLFELYATYKEEGLVKSPSGFQKLLVNQAREYIQSLIDEKIKA